MRWNRATLQPFLDVRTDVLNDTLEDALRHRYPSFRPPTTIKCWQSRVISPRNALIPLRNAAPKGLTNEAIILSIFGQSSLRRNLVPEILSTIRGGSLALGLLTYVPTAARAETITLLCETFNGPRYVERIDLHLPEFTVTLFYENGAEPDTVRLFSNKKGMTWSVNTELLGRSIRGTFWLDRTSLRLSAMMNMDGMNIPGVERQCKAGRPLASG